MCPAGTCRAGSPSPLPAGPQRCMDLPACPNKSNLGCAHKQNARSIGKLEVKQRHLMSSGAFGLGPAEPCVPAVLPAVACVSVGWCSAVGLGSAFFPPRSSIA